MLKCPIHELPNNVIINNFYARLSLYDKDLLDASCAGSFTRMKEEAKWDLLDRIQENTEGWVLCASPFGYLMLSTPSGLARAHMMQQQIKSLSR